MIVSTEIELPDGRSLTVHDTGDPAGAPVVYHHGTPGTGRPFPGHERMAEEGGVRLLSYDRAGYASSSRHAGRRISDVAADVEALADAFGIARFATWGHSGGGPHALACAALLPDRVAAVASLAGVAPYGAHDLDWAAGMGEMNVQEFEAALGGEAALRPALEAETSALGELDVAGLVEMLSTLLPDVDVAALDGDVGPYMLSSFRAAVATGVDGWLDDSLAFVAPWGFEPADVAVPTLVLQGGRDLMVPAAHGRWLADRISGAEAWLREDEGHITLVAVESVARVHAWLLERL